MIRRSSIDDRVREWNLREDVVEKDYVLGWVLWGIGSDPRLGAAWAFKGGTCLKKCYIETYRFSEDLDFTVVHGGPLSPEELAPVFQALLERVSDQSGIDFTVRAPHFRKRPTGQTAEGRIYYRGPRNAPSPASIKIDLTGDESIVRPTVLRRIAHSHDDQLPPPAVVRCYGFEEVFAEKIRALGERCRPRDLYDVVNLFRRRDLRTEPKLILSVLAEKCRRKGVPLPTFDSLQASPYRAELESEWENMLAHQLPALPPFGHFWEELPILFGWLDGTTPVSELPPAPSTAEEDTTWSPPPTVWTWGAGVPLETIRFAAANHLCVELRYQGSTRVIEPYSLRRTRDGKLVLHALRADSREHRSYRVDRMQGVAVTTHAFRPVYAIEFSASGPIVALSTTENDVPDSHPRGAGFRGPTYVIECTVCGKRFSRSRSDTALRPHKDKGGWECYGRYGHLVDVRYD